MEARLSSEIEIQRHALRENEFELHRLSVVAPDAAAREAALQLQLVEAKTAAKSEITRLNGLVAALERRNVNDRKAMLLAVEQRMQVDCPCAFRAAYILYLP